MALAVASTIPGVGIIIFLILDQGHIKLVSYSCGLYPHDSLVHK